MIFTIVIQRQTDNATIQAIFKYSTMEDALSKYHTELAASIGNPNLNYCMCCILTEYGSIEKSEVWQRADNG